VLKGVNVKLMLARKVEHRFEGVKISETKTSYGFFVVSADKNAWVPFRGGFSNRLSGLKPRASSRVGLTIGQTGKMPGTSRFGASRLNIKTLLYLFFMFLGCSPRVKIVELFDYCV